MQPATPDQIIKFIEEKLARWSSMGWDSQRDHAESFARSAEAIERGWMLSHNEGGVSYPASAMREMAESLHAQAMAKRAALIAQDQDSTPTPSDSVATEPLSFQAMSERASARLAATAQEATPPCLTQADLSAVAHEMPITIGRQPATFYGWGDDDDPDNFLGSMLTASTQPSPALGICDCGHEGRAGEALCFICASNEAHALAVEAQGWHQHPASGCWVRSLPGIGEASITPMLGGQSAIRAAVTLVGAGTAALHATKSIGEAMAWADQILGQSSEAL